MCVCARGRMKGSS
uniref:Uncharacterized protein n=1 Tax=Rhizophora mucronata TaxID=61149 RepID=A0A2P2Q0U8_RHIMU